MAGRILRWFGKFNLVFTYFRAIIAECQDIIAGVSVPTVGMTLWMWLGNPPIWARAAYLTFALLCAGYFVWYADHVRLMPKVEVEGIKYQSTPTVFSGTGQETGSALYVQLRLKCHTPVEGCSGHLREVQRWCVKKQDWEETEMNESQPLEWSLAGHNPITLEPGNEKRLNIFSIHSTNNLIYPLVERYPLRARSLFKCDDTFRFDILISGKDCKPVTLFVKVKRGTTWDKPEATII